MTRHALVVSVVGLAMAMGGTAEAAPLKIQFDVSDNVGSYTGYESPGYAAGDFTTAETTWNMTEGDVSSGLKYADGTDATTVTFDTGQGGGATVNWSSTPPTSQTGAGGGIYATSLMRDWHYTSGNNNLGARVNGLPAGEYRVYALVREPSELGRLYDVSIGVNIDTIGASPTAITNATGVTTWTVGKNYAVADLTTTASTDWLSIIVDPTNNQYGTLEGVQIVQIPEPMTMALLALGLPVMIRRRRA